jgi:hypothetical protein
MRIGTNLLSFLFLNHGHVFPHHRVNVTINFILLLLRKTMDVKKKCLAKRKARQ